MEKEEGKMLTKEHCIFVITSNILQKFLTEREKEKGIDVDLWVDAWVGDAILVVCITENCSEGLSIGYGVLDLYSVFVCVCVQIVMVLCIYTRCISTFYLSYGQQCDLQCMCLSGHTPNSTVWVICLPT